MSWSVCECQIVGFGKLQKCSDTDLPNQTLEGFEGRRFPKLFHHPTSSSDGVSSPLNWVWAGSCSVVTALFVNSNTQVDRSDSPAVSYHRLYPRIFQVDSELPVYAEYSTFTYFFVLINTQHYHWYFIFSTPHLWLCEIHYSRPPPSYSSVHLQSSRHTLNS